MITFLYYLPFVLLGLSLLSHVLAYLLNGNEKDVLGLNEPKIRFFYLVIPIIIVIAGFYVTADDFKELYVPWSIYGIFVFIGFCSELYLRHLRGKVADKVIGDFKDKLAKRMEEIEKEEKNEK